MNEDQTRITGWARSRPLLHLVASVRGDELDLPIIEDDYGREDSLFGWVASEETHLPLNVWTKRFKDWYEKVAGGTLIDHEIAPAYKAVLGGASVAHKEANDGKAAILEALGKLGKVREFLEQEYQARAQKLADSISAVSSDEEDGLKGDFQRHIESLNKAVLEDLKAYDE